MPIAGPGPAKNFCVRVSERAAQLPPSRRSPPIRAIALEPWKFDTQKVTVTGNFRGRNLFGDLPGAPGKSRYDFVLRGVEGAIWVTNLRPRGSGFELDVNRRVDTDQVARSHRHDRQGTGPGVARRHPAGPGQATTGDRCAGGVGGTATPASTGPGRVQLADRW